MFFYKNSLPIFIFLLRYEKTNSHTLTPFDSCVFIYTIKLLNVTLRFSRKFQQVSGISKFCIVHLEKGFSKYELRRSVKHIVNLLDVLNMKIINDGAFDEHFRICIAGFTVQSNTHLHIHCLP